MTLQYLWLRCGDGGNYENYGDDFTAAALAAFEMGVRTPLNWLSYPRSTGFESEGYRGPVNHVSCYWGDKQGDFTAPLNPVQREAFEQEIKDLEEEYGREASL